MGYLLIFILEHLKRCFMLNLIFSINRSTWRIRHKELDDHIKTRLEKENK